MYSLRTGKSSEIQGIATSWTGQIVVPRIRPETVTTNSALMRRIWCQKMRGIDGYERARVPKPAEQWRWRCRVETSVGTAWRRGRDSNPGYPRGHAAFRVRCFRPLSHLSAEDSRPLEKNRWRNRSAANSGSIPSCQGARKHGWHLWRRRRLSIATDPLN